MCFSCLEVNLKNRSRVVPILYLWASKMISPADMAGGKMIDDTSLIYDPRLDDASSWLATSEISDLLSFLGLPESEPSLGCSTFFIYYFLSSAFIYFLP